MGNLIAALQPKKKFIAGHLLLPFFFFFFFFFSQGHMKQKNGGQLPILAAVSAAILAVSAYFGGRFGRNQQYRLLFLLESGRIGPNRPVSAQISTNRKKRANQHVRRQTPCRDESSVGAATLELHPCFPDLEQCLTFNLDIFLFSVCQHT